MEFILKAVEESLKMKIAEIKALREENDRLRKAYAELENVVAAREKELITLHNRNKELKQGLNDY